MLTVPTKEDVYDIIRNGKKLKDAGEAYKKIYVKRDTHPEVRKEWRRLRETLTLEKARPENVGHQLEMNYKQKCVLRDGVAIDRWQSPFLM